MLDFTDYNIPLTTQESISNYIEHGIDPGDFVYSVMSNNLHGAVLKADIMNTAALKDIVLWVYNNAPGNRWGNEAVVLRWIETNKKAKLGLTPVV